MTNEEYESAVARADDFLDTLKDTCHDQYDKIQELQYRIDSAICYIDKLNEMTEFEFENEYWMKNLIDILKGEKNE